MKSGRKSKTYKVKGNSVHVVIGPLELVDRETARKEADAQYMNGYRNGARRAIEEASRLMGTVTSPQTPDRVRGLTDLIVDMTKAIHFTCSNS